MTIRVYQPVLPDPVELGLPEKFTAWRPGQDRSVVKASSLDKRFLVAALPTGFGKSLFAAGIAKLVGRTTVLTSTKALQDQYADDFASIGMIDVRGQNAYDCRALIESGHLEDADAGFAVMNRRAKAAAATGDYSDRTTCDEGPCHYGMRCNLRPSRGGGGGRGCHYYDQVHRATLAEIVTTNYPFWFNTNAYRRVELAGGKTLEGIGKFDALVCDEAHDAPDQLSAFLTSVLDPHDIRTLLDELMPALGISNAAWRAWAESLYMHAVAETELALEHVAITARTGGDARSAKRKARKLQNIVTGLDRLQTPDVTWVVEPAPALPDEKPSPLPRLQFAPLWPGPLAQQTLFKETPRVVLMSATIRPKTMDYLGVSRGDYEFWEERAPFPLARRPVYVFGDARLRYPESDETIFWWLKSIDQIIRSRPGVRGIIHATSFKRAQLILERSAFAAQMITHVSSGWRGGGMNLQQALVEFRRRPPEDSPWLISPSVTTGYDFAGDLCRVQIIAKVPFADSKSALIKARLAADRSYTNYQAMQTLVQAAGRIVRSESDWGECVSPETPVLTADLRWRSAGDMKDGDPLLCFDEQSGGRGYGRKWVTGHVIKSVTSLMPRVRLTHEEGEVICTPNHPWLMQDPKCGTSAWRRTDELKVGQRLLRVLPLWPEAASYRDGWLAGFFDGEGCLSIGSNGREYSFLCASQKEGPLLYHATKMLTDAGVKFSVHKQTDTQRQIRLIGGFPEVLRFLGQMRPERLLRKFQQRDRDQQVKAISYPRVLAVEKLAPGPIASLQTSAKTYVAAGLAAHNTFIVDRQIDWLLKPPYDDLSPQWFRDAVQRIHAIPRPLGERLAVG